MSTQSTTGSVTVRADDDSPLFRRGRYLVSRAEAASS
jgi:hypothetical protein